MDVELVLKGVKQCVAEGGDHRNEFDEEIWRRIRETWPDGDSGVEGFIERLKTIL